MLRIRARDLGIALQRTASSTGKFAQDCGRNEATFLRSAWQVAEAVQPLVSEPLGFFFNPGTRRRYSDRYKLSLPAGDPTQADALSALYESHSGLAGDLERFKEDLRRVARETIQAKVPPLGNLKSVDREWTVRCLRDLEYPGNLPPQMLEPKRLHLGAYLSFHLGRMTPFAKDCMRQAGFGQLPRFWRGVIGWFGDPPAPDCERQLEKVVKSGTEKKGHRRLALLLLWTRSNLSSKDLMRLTRRNADLQQNSVHYRGSPPLPVNEAGPSIHSPNESMAKLEQSVRMKPDEAGTRNNSVMNNVQDLFGANVESDKMQKWAERICNPFLKAMVCGGRERDRAIMMRELAARTGHPAKEWAEWSLSTARASQEQFRDDLIQWRCGTGPFGTILTQLRGCVFLAKEIQTWPQESQELICDLLQPSVAGEAGHAWHDPVIASTDKTYRRPPRDPIQRLFLERLPVQLNLDLGPEKPAWMQRYSKVSYRELERLTDISKSSLQEYLTKETFRGEPVARNFEGCTYVHRQWLAANRVRTAPSKRPKDRRSD